MASPNGMAWQGPPPQEWGEKTVVLQVESGEDLLQLQQAAEQLQLPSYLVRVGTYSGLSEGWLREARLRC